MDLKKLLEESESMKQAIADQTKANDLKQYLGISHPGELDKAMHAARSGILDSAAFTSEIAARQAAEHALGISGFQPTDFQTSADTMQKEFERAAGLGALASGSPLSLANQFQADIEKVSGLMEKEAASYLQGRTFINFEEIEEQEKQRQQERLVQMGNDHAQHIFRETVEFRRREEAKIEYARRSAEASEKALAEERRKREVAELAAQEAKADKEKAENRADRNERFAIIGLVGMVAGLALAAWPYVKDALGL